jgi:hypothetical protein
MTFAILGLRRHLRFVWAALFDHSLLPFADAAKDYQICARLDCSSYHPGYDGRK